MDNIIFLESPIYLNKLGIFKSIINFNGIKDYKIKDIKVKKYTLLISQLYTNPVSNFLILKAKRNNVKTLLVSDGIIDWANLFSNPMTSKYNLNLYHPILHDIFLCVGKEETKYFNFLGYKTMQYLPERIAPTIDKLALSNTKTFLITTANTAYFNETEKKHLIKLLKKVIKNLDDLSYKYIFRVFDSSLIDELSIKKEENIQSGNFEECLKLVDYVITTPSSISLTAMYHDRAVAHLIYRDSPMFIQTGWNISSSVDIENSLKSIMTMDKNRMNYQKFQVANYIVDNEKVEQKVMKELKKVKSENIEKFINQNLYNMLNSSFNFNIEYFARKIYLNFKDSKIMKILRKKVI